MKAVVAAFNQEKALVGAFSVITNLQMDLFQALFLAFVVVLQRYLASNGAKSQLAGYQYQLVSDLESSMCHKEKGEATISPDWRGRLQRFWLVYRRSLIIMGCVSLQALMTSIIWNYFVINYHAVLETDVAGAVNLEAVVETQNSILTSSAMWMVSYFWRLVNPQTMTQYQLLALLYSKVSRRLRSSPVSAEKNIYTHYKNICGRSASWC